jgi:indole-3-glycerol phosphate synthase
VSDFLGEMSDVSAVRASAARDRADDIQARIVDARPPLPLGLSSHGFDVIAEVKLASPAEGPLDHGGAERVVELARAYAASGAVALSVLTEESRFAGSLDHLESASSVVDVPVMRKDFLVDPIQVLEARAAGASGVLLIARLLPEALLAEMTDLTLDLGMFALIEVFDRSDLETAVSVFDRDVLVGVNCRDLSTLGVDKGRFDSLAAHLPRDLPAVAESGIETAPDAASVARLGYRLALVGSALVRSDDPGSTLAGMIASGRSAMTGAGT